MKLDNISKRLLKEIAGLHEIPSGAVSFRKNGKSFIQSSPNIEIFKKENGCGIDVVIHSSCKGEACHIPVVVSEDGLFEVVYNDFFIEDNAEVVIVAGCGVHSNDGAGHDGIHSLHIGKNAKVTYVENHLAIGEGLHKELSPVTKIKLGEGSELIMNTTQIGGVDFSNRKTTAVLSKNATLTVNEKILTSRFEVAKTDFMVDMKGENCKCNIISRSVAKDESEQVFKSNLVGKNCCFGHVECDGILMDSARIDSAPKVSAKHKDAMLTHEAAIGKISSEQILKLMTLGLSEKEAEEKIIEGFLK